MDAAKLEKYSSAITLGDMEVFVYPDLMYSLVLANIMSPIIWQWKEESSFKKLRNKSPYRKLMRLKQYIMDRYDFNLDLNTWGLTHKDVELQRFKDAISPEDIAKSNALFGYTGDKYYFDVDIRRHFGLDKYDGDIIPYWKTETVEAMTAFQFKDGYDTGAGECVSLSTLYAAAAFIICDIPLEDIFLVLTPLHSQNFIDMQDGIITNNRRIVTKSMWFNGTEISNKAQRALRNEQVTIVTNNTGSIHCFYDNATINPDEYRRFKNKIGTYLTTELDSLMFANFLRTFSQYHPYFQFCRHRRGDSMFVKAEVLFHYEHGSPNRIYDASFNKLLDEVSNEDYSIYKNPERLCCEQLMAFLRYENIDIHSPDDRKKLSDYISAVVPDAGNMVETLHDFIHLQPRLPDENKNYIKTEPITIKPGQTRHEIIEYLDSMRDKNTVADLAFYAYRDMDRCHWQPFIKAAVERCPVSIEMSSNMSDRETYNWLNSMPGSSIYDTNRLAQPDEVVNFEHGDGIEKAFTLANILHARHEDADIEISIDKDKVTLTADEKYDFSSGKNLKKEICIPAKNKAPK